MDALLGRDEHVGPLVDRLEPRRDRLGPLAVELDPLVALLLAAGRDTESVERLEVRERRKADAHDPGVVGAVEPRANLGERLEPVSA